MLFNTAKNRKYKYRNLPCNIQPDEKLWCIVGQDNFGGGGVLEWCYDREDAEERLQEMKASGEFKNLSAEPYQK